MGKHFTVTFEVDVFAGEDAETAVDAAVIVYRDLIHRSFLPTVLVEDEDGNRQLVDLEDVEDL